MADPDMAPELPPRPDPNTGLPRPPHAPNFIGNRKTPNSDPDPQASTSSRPEPPPGQGPVLAWYRSSRRGALVAAVAGVVVIMLVLFVIKGLNVQVLELWWLWLLAFAAGVGIYFSVKADSCAAGADWFTYQKSWAKTYELTEIKTHFYSNTVYIYLADVDGHKVEAPINVIQQDRLIWDLLYNGIRHSIVKGAALKGTARHYFTVA